MSTNAGKFIMLTNQAGIPTVAYEPATDNIMPPHVLLGDAEANKQETQANGDKPVKQTFLNGLFQDKEKLKKVGIFSALALLGITVGYYFWNKRKNKG